MANTDSQPTVQLPSSLWKSGGTAHLLLVRSGGPCHAKVAIGYWGIVH